MDGEEMTPEPVETPEGEEGAEVSEEITVE